MLVTLFSDSTYKSIIGATVLVAALVTLALSSHLAHYVLGFGVLTLMLVAKNREEPWSRKLVPVFIAVFGAVVLLNQI